jgi:hypothetical protein
VEELCQLAPGRWRPEPGNGQQRQQPALKRKADAAGKEDAGTGQQQERNKSKAAEGEEEEEEEEQQQQQGTPMQLRARRGTAAWASFLPRKRGPSGPPNNLSPQRTEVAAAAAKPAANQAAAAAAAASKAVAGHPLQQGQPEVSAMRIAVLQPAAAHAIRGSCRYILRCECRMSAPFATAPATPTSCAHSFNCRLFWRLCLLI